MTDLERHVAAVEAHPFDKVAALALVDHLVEVEGRSRLSALCKVAQIRRPGRQAAHLVRAARVMRCRTVARRALGMMIEEVAGIEHRDNYHVMLIPGHKPPHVADRAPPPFGVHDLEPLVLLGSRWVLHYYGRLLRLSRVYNRSRGPGRER